MAGTSLAGDHTVIVVCIAHNRRDVLTMYRENWFFFFRLSRYRRGLLPASAHRLVCLDAFCSTIVLSVLLPISVRPPSSTTARCTVTVTTIPRAMIYLLSNIMQ